MAKTYFSFFGSDIECFTIVFALEVKKVTALFTIETLAYWKLALLADYLNGHSNVSQFIAHEFFCLKVRNSKMQRIPKLLISHFSWKARVSNRNICEIQTHTFNFYCRTPKLWLNTKLPENNCENAKTVQFIIRAKTRVYKKTQSVLPSTFSLLWSYNKHSNISLWIWSKCDTDL